MAKILLASVLAKHGFDRKNTVPRPGKLRRHSAYHREPAQASSHQAEPETQDRFRAALDDALLLELLPPNLMR